MPNDVARHADTVLLMVRGTWYGPTRRKPFARKVSADQTRLALDAPPEPAINPLRACDTAAATRPASFIASCMATYAYAAASPMKRRFLRSIWSSSTISTDPQTWLRRPISANFSLKRIPGLPWRKDSSTDSLLLPRQETRH